MPLSSIKKVSVLIIVLSIAGILLTACGKSQDENFVDSTMPSSTEESTETVSETETAAQIELTQETAGEILRCYSRTSMFGLFAETESNYMPISIPKPFDATYDFFKATNFNTVSEGSKLTRQFLSDEIADKYWNMHKDAVFTDNNNVVFAMCGHGIGSYEKTSIRILPTGEGKATVSVDVYDETEEYSGTFSFNAEYNGKQWRMVTEPIYTYNKTELPTNEKEFIW